MGSYCVIHLNRVHFLCKLLRKMRYSSNEMSNRLSKANMSNKVHGPVPMYSSPLLIAKDVTQQSCV